MLKQFARIQQGSEPSGTQGGEDEEATAGGARESPPNPARRRRLIAMSDDEDDEASNETAKRGEAADADKEGDEAPKAAGDYLQGVSVVDGGITSLTCLSLFAARNMHIVCLCCRVWRACPQHAQLCRNTV